MDPKKVTIPKWTRKKEDISLLYYLTNGHQPKLIRKSKEGHFLLIKITTHRPYYNCRHLSIKPRASEFMKY